MTDQSILFKPGLLLKLVRWPNLLIIIITQYSTAVFLIRYTDPVILVILDLKLFLVILSTVLIASAGYIINDYYDIKIDYLNKPERVIVGKDLNRRYALVAHTVISFIGISLGFWIHWTIGLTTLLAAFMLWLYSNLLKRLPFVGNLAIGILTGLSILLIAMYYHDISLPVAGYSIFGLVFTLIREVIKDIEDLKGDLSFGCKTLPIIWGIRKTKSFIFFLILTFVILFLAIILPYNILKLYFYLVILTIPLLYFILKLMRADTRKEFSDLSAIAKIIMVMGIGSMIFFKI